MRAMAEVQGSPRSLLSPPNCRDRPGSWQFPDKDASFVDDLDRQLVAVEHGHPDERISVGVHEDTTRTFVPDDLGLINVEEGFAPVRQDSSLRNGRSSMATSGGGKVKKPLNPVSTTASISSRACGPRTVRRRIASR